MTQGRMGPPVVSLALWEVAHRDHVCGGLLPAGSNTPR